MRTIEDYTRWTQVVKPYCFDKLTVVPGTETVRDIYKAHPKLVNVLSHGPAASPPYVNIGLFDIMVNNGGGDRSLMGVAWKHFYKVPGMSRFVRYVTQVNEPHNFDQFVELFINGDFTDFNVYPEGANCVYGNSIDMQPFVSPRFLEFAVRAKVPILLIVHHGTENAAIPVRVSRDQAQWVKRFAPKTGALLEASGQVGVPNPFAGKISELKFSFELYQPQLKLKDLPEERSARLAILGEEAEVVRGLMQDMTDGLKENPPTTRRGYGETPRNSPRKQPA